MSMSGADADTEPARRFEVFTGASRRREWSDEAKAAIVSEMRRRTRLHWHDASRLVGQQRREPCYESARLYRTVPSSPTAQTRKLPFERLTASMLTFVVDNEPLPSVSIEPSWHTRCRWWRHPPHQFRGERGTHLARSDRPCGLHSSAGTC